MAATAVTQKQAKFGSETLVSGKKKLEENIDRLLSKDHAEDIENEERISSNKSKFKVNNQLNSSKLVASDGDESDSNYLNKRHTLQHQQLDEDDGQHESMDLHLGAKKRKRQIASSNQLQQISSNEHSNDFESKLLQQKQLDNKSNNLNANKLANDKTTAAATATTAVIASSVSRRKSKKLYNSSNSSTHSSSSASSTASNDNVLKTNGLNKNSLNGMHDDDNDEDFDENSLDDDEENDANYENQLRDDNDASYDNNQQNGDDEYNVIDEQEDEEEMNNNTEEDEDGDDHKRKSKRLKIKFNHPFKSSNQNASQATNELASTINMFGFNTDQINLNDFDPILLANTLAAAAANFQNGGLNFAGVPGVGNNGASSSKVFQVDAYCYLCKKEFCNKYFLRTHLANKHKVFLNGNENPMSKFESAGGDMDERDSLAKKSHKTSSTGNKNGSSSNNNRSSSTSSQSSSASSGSTSGSSSASISPVPQHNSHSQQTNSNNAHHSSQSLVNSIYGNQQLTSSSSSTSSSISSSSNAKYMKGELNDSNNQTATVEDFCELCNKQFCNKYYLKVSYLSFFCILISIFVNHSFKYILKNIYIETQIRRAWNPGREQH